eukprot:76866-Rhodomonas_salina.2
MRERVRRIRTARVKGCGMGPYTLRLELKRRGRQESGNEGDWTVTQRGGARCAQKRGRTSLKLMAL